MPKKDLKVIISVQILKIHSWVRDNFWQLKAFQQSQKNPCYFLLKAFLLHASPYVLVGYEGKWLDKEDKISFKIYKVTAWKTNNYNTLIGQYHMN